MFLELGRLRFGGEGLEFLLRGPQAEWGKFETLTEESMTSQQHNHLFLLFPTVFMIDFYILCINEYPTYGQTMSRSHPFTSSPMVHRHRWCLVSKLLIDKSFLHRAVSSSAVQKVKN